MGDLHCRYLPMDLAKQTGLGVEIYDLEGPFLVTGQQTNQTDVNSFPSLKGFTGVQQVIPLNPDSTVEFSTIADKRKHDSKHMRRLLTENKEKHWNSNALTIKILPLNTGIRKIRVCFNAATNVMSQC